MVARLLRPYLHPQILSRNDGRREDGITSTSTNKRSAHDGAFVERSETTSAVPPISELRNQRVAIFLSCGAFGQQAQRLMNAIKKDKQEMNYSVLFFCFFSFGQAKEKKEVK